MSFDPPTYGLIGDDESNGEPQEIDSENSEDPVESAYLQSVSAHKQLQDVIENSEVVYKNKHEKAFQKHKEKNMEVIDTSAIMSTRDEENEQMDIDYYQAPTMNINAWKYNENQNLEEIEEIDEEQDQM